MFQFIVSGHRLSPMDPFPISCSKSRLPGVLEEVFAQCSIGMFVVEEDSGAEKITLMNKAAFDILGINGGSHSCSITCANPLARLNLRDRDGNEFAYSKLPVIRALRNGEPSSNNILRLLRGDGKEKWLATTAVPLSQKKDGRRSAASIFTDVSDQVNAEVELRRNQSRQVTSQKYQSMGLMAGGIAHDFNNLLMVVLGNLELLISEEARDSNKQKFLSAAFSAAKNAAELSRQILRYCGRDKTEKSSIDLNKVIREIIPECNCALNASSTLVIEQAEPTLLVSADPDQIKQLLINLVANAAEAIAHLDEGKIFVRSGNQTCDDAYLQKVAFDYNGLCGDFVFIEVQDNGLGMSEATRAQMFDPFFSTKCVGRGMGLATVQGILRAHGGFAEVRSDRGKGCCVRVYLPRQ